MKAVECRNLALPHLNPPGERVTIPYEGKALYGILRKPNGVAKPPVLVMCVGLDSAKEETDAYERPYLDRGIATLVFDGPGQGEGEYDFAIRGDYEVAVKAVVDTVMTRRDLDTSRIGLWGVSFGGYYAPRAAAFEKRIKACIALGGPYDWEDNWDKLPELTREAFRVRSHCATQADAKRHALTLSLKGVAQNIDVSDLCDDRKAGPADPVAARAAPRQRGEGPVHLPAGRGRQPRRQQPRLSLAGAERGLAGGAASLEPRTRAASCACARCRPA